MFFKGISSSLDTIFSTHDIIRQTENDIFFHTFVLFVNDKNELF